MLSSRERSARHRRPPAPRSRPAPPAAPRRVPHRLLQPASRPAECVQAQVPAAACCRRSGARRRNAASTRPRRRERPSR
ncbi:hypothetical protein DEO45_01435 [Rhodanobacter denitrificans]|uniref:Uncharacterized protein n=1 Tax=Rhodanobacter denitrificans TaxID=666685 RepID=A0A368KJR1_9GAMM|nr:hypothetical protein DEO45_01435 [Rhodanobacter denitrificans]